MASPRNDTPDTPSLDNPTVIDASTKELLYDLDDLTVPFEELAHAAQQCYDERFESDVRNMARDDNRRKERAGIESQLECVREQAAHLKQRRAAIISRIPPHLLTHARSSADLAEAELDAVLLEIEEQKLDGVFIMNENTYDEIRGTEVDVKSIRDPNTRTELKAALDKFQDALLEFRTAFNDHSAGRRECIGHELRDLEARRLVHGKSSVLPQSPELPGDEVDDRNCCSADTATVASSFISDLSLGSPAIPIKEPSEVKFDMSSADANEGMFRFDRDNPPSLLRLANWLGLDGGVDVALLLNQWPIQNAFQTYRAGPVQQSCADNPERLKLVLALFTYPRETLKLWQAHVDQKGEEQKESRLDIPAALFANHVVRFLERSSDVVPWNRVSGDIANLGDFEVARCRWAVVLQMFWFMQRAFGNVNQL
ncbi:hypothetical protein F4801DRAFT_574022 [Xylaria longipes]|nr:hypothetical protein F4801DRAFT_574022 [Xylaria longipes]